MASIATSINVKVECLSYTFSVLYNIYGLLVVQSVYIIKS